MDPELQKKINIRAARGWTPAPGASIVGTIAAITMRTGGQYEDYPILTFAADGDDPEAVEYTAVHAMHGALKSALYELKPSVGDRLSITYHGKVASKGRKDSEGNAVKYHSYTVLDPDAADEAETFSWDESDTPGF